MLWYRDYFIVLNGVFNRDLLHIIQMDIWTLYRTYVEFCLTGILVFTLLIIYTMLLVRSGSLSGSWLACINLSNLHIHTIEHCVWSLVFVYILNHIIPEIICEIYIQFGSSFHDLWPIAKFFNVHNLKKCHNDRRRYASSLPHGQWC